MALPSWLLVPVDGSRSQRPWPSSTLESFRHFHHQRHKSRVSLRSPSCAQGVLGNPYGEVRNTFDVHGGIIICVLGLAKRHREDLGTMQALDKDCHPPLHEDCLKYHGHKGDPRVIPKTCGAIGERAQVNLVWTKASDIKNAFHPWKYEVTGVRPSAMRSL